MTFRRWAGDKLDDWIGGFLPNFHTDPSIQ